MNPRKILTGVLLAFVVLSAAWFLVGKLKGSPDSSAKTTANTAETVMVYYFHRTARCMTCMKIETLAKTEVEKSFAEEISDGKLRFESVNVETGGNEHFVTDYSLVSQALVLVDRRSGQNNRWKDLDQIWDLVHEPADFTRYVHDEVDAFMGPS